MFLEDLCIFEIGFTHVYAVCDRSSYITALLAAAAPDQAPFMADECLMAIPEIEGIDYTTKEYLKFVQHIQSTVERLNKESKFRAASSFIALLYIFYYASVIEYFISDEKYVC